MRQIELLGVFLRRIAGHVEVKEMVESERLLDEAARRLVGLEMPILENQTFDGLRRLLSLSGDLDPAKAFAAASLLDRRAGMAAEQDEVPTAFRHWSSAFCLFTECHALPDEPLRELCRENIERVERRLLEFDLPDFVLHAQFAYHERRGDFGRAEDALFALAERDDDDAGPLGRAFYDRLNRHSDAELAAGSFSRAEIAEGLAALSRMAPGSPEIRSDRC